MLRRRKPRSGRGARDAVAGDHEKVVGDRIRQPAEILADPVLQAIDECRRIAGQREAGVAT
jgi:hypothetical protein